MKMPWYIVRSCRARSLPVVIVSGVGLVLYLFYVLTSRTNHYLEANSLQWASQSRVRSYELEKVGVHAVGRDNGGVPVIQDRNGGYIPVAVAVEDHIASKRILDSVNSYTSSMISYEQDMIRRSESVDIEERSKFQMEQIDKYCRDHQDKLGRKFHLPGNDGAKELLYRHLLYDDHRKAMFCFVEKVGCTDMKRMWFVSVGALPVRTINDEWVDLKYLEKAIRRASLQNNSLDDSTRLNMIRDYYKFVIIRHPLERLVSGFRNKIEPPFNDMSVRFPNYIKLTILQRYRKTEFERWMDSKTKYNLSVTFEEFVLYYVNSDLTKINPHLKPVIHTCYPCRVRYNFYGNFRTYGQDALMAMRRLNIDSRFYRNKSLHTSSQQTSSYLGHYYDRLSDALKVRLYSKLRQELEFYYMLYPRERDSHIAILGVEGT